MTSDSAHDIGRQGLEPASAGRAAWIERLVVTQFRTYVRAALSLDPRPVVLVGPNGTGKTNLLEAVSLLSPGRGLRGAPTAELRRRPPGAGEARAAAAGWGIRATLQAADGPIEIATGVEGPPSASERRIVRIEDETVPATRLSQLTRMVWLTPAMDRIFTEGAAGRRKLLDRLVLAFEPEHGGRVLAYERAMRERTRLLAEPPYDAGWVTALEVRMVEAGLAMAAARQSLVHRLAVMIETRDDASPFPKAVLSLNDETAAALTRDDMETAGAALAGRLREARARDGAAGRALVGPHRADLAVHHKAKGIEAHLCSTGEQKALLVGILLAHARLELSEASGAAPILLLDEVAAHLDSDRRAALFDEICALDLQAWMTGTDRHLFEALGERAQTYTVRDGDLLQSA